MKMYTNIDQTAKLIELGFDKPRLLYFGNNTIGHYAYTIGELIEMLPMFLDEEYGYTLSIYNDITKWIVAYDNGDECSTIYAITKDELIDSLYTMIIKLKEEGEIC